MTARMLTDAQLAELAKNPNNVVYEYANREAPAEPMSLDQIEQQARDCWQRFRELRADRELTDAQFDKIKQELDVEFEALEYSQPLLYTRIVDRETTQAHVDALMFIIKVKQEDPSDAGRAKVSEKIKEQFPILK